MDNFKFITCLICGEVKKELGAHLIAKHGINNEKYREVYPEALVVSPESQKRRSERQIGSKNSSHRIKDKEGYSKKMSKVMTGKRRTKEQLVNYSLAASKRIMDRVSPCGHPKYKHGWLDLSRLKLKVYFHLPTKKQLYLI
jgi:sugar diacid utilization regulator